MDKLKQIETRRTELLKEMNDNLLKIEKLRDLNTQLSREVVKLEREKERLQNEDIIKKFKKLAAEEFPNGYTIYRTIVTTDYIGTDSHNVIIWDNKDDILCLEEDLVEQARENAMSYGYTLEEELPALCEEYGYDDEDELIEELDLEISDYGYSFYEVKIEDLDIYEIQELINIYL